MTTVKWLALLLTVMGALSIAAGAILVPLATAKFALTTLGLSGGPIAAALGGIASRLWAILGPVGKVTAAFALGYEAGTLLSKGIDWALSKLLGYETTLGASTYDLVQKIKGGIGGAVDWVQTLPGRMTSAGSDMINGLIGGITSRMEALRQTVTGAGDGAISWFKAKLGIHSPSRVFAELGMHTMAGLEQGLAENEGGPLGTLSALAKKLAVIGAAMAIGQPALALVLPQQPAVQNVTRQVTDTRQATALPAPLAVIRDVIDRIASAVLPNPLDATRLISDKHQALALPDPLAAVRQISDQYQPLEQTQPLGGSRRGAGGQSAGPVQQAGDTYHITIQRAPGGSDDDLMRKLESMLERIQQKKQTAARSRLRDLE